MTWKHPIWRLMWRWPKCEHVNVRCTHGDEIIGRRYKRRVCVDCGRALDGPLPEPCSVTGEPHLSAHNDGQEAP